METTQEKTTPFDIQQLFIDCDVDADTLTEALNEVDPSNRRGVVDSVRMAGQYQTPENFRHIVEHEQVQSDYETVNRSYLTDLFSSIIKHPEKGKRPELARHASRALIPNPFDYDVLEEYMQKQAESNQYPTSMVIAILEPHMDDVIKRYNGGVEYFARANQASILRRFLQKGADPNKKIEHRHSDSESPLDAALSHGAEEAAVVLFEHGGKIAPSHDNTARNRSYLKTILKQHGFDEEKIEGTLAARTI